MERIPLSKVASQTVSFTADSEYWTIKVYPAISHMAADVSLNGTTLISGIRCFAGYPVVPYQYLIGDTLGNFIFDTEPDWENFGTSPTCNLYYLTAAELASYNALIETGDASGSINN